MAELWPQVRPWWSCSVATGDRVRGPVVACRSSEVVAGCLGRAGGGDYAAMKTPLAAVTLLLATTLGFAPLQDPQDP